MAGDDATDSGVRSVGRVVDLLESFDVTHPTRTMRELQLSTGLPKTTVLRLVSTLVARGVLSQRREGEFTLGPELLRWSRLAGQVWTPSPEVVAVMRRLSEQTGETANLYARQGLSRVVVAQAESSSTVRSVVPLGVPFPLGTGAASKVLLLDHPELVDEAATRSGDATTAEQLRADVEACRQRGHQLSHGEREQGASGLSFPVRGRHGDVVAALTLGGPTGRFTEERLPTYISATRAAALEVEQLGLPGLD